MLVVICPQCESYYVEHGKTGKIDCMKCGLEFDSLQNEKYIPVDQLYEMLTEKYKKWESEKQKIRYKPQMTIQKTKAQSFTQQNNLEMIKKLKEQLKED